MKTVLIEKDNIKIVSKTLEADEVVAFPTETVFGLAVKYGSLEALDKLYKLKHRDTSKAITLMLSSIDDILKYAYCSSRDKKIIQQFMPGEITIILNKKEDVKDEFTSSLKTIGIRIPNDQFVLDLIEMTGPLLVTSANHSGSASLVTSRQVLETFENDIPLIVEGECKSKVASTVVDLSKDEIKVLREGNIKLDDIKESLK